MLSGFCTIVIFIGQHDINYKARLPVVQLLSHFFTLFFLQLLLFYRYSFLLNTTSIPKPRLFFFDKNLFLWNKMVCATKWLWAWKETNWIALWSLFRAKQKKAFSTVDVLSISLSLFFLLHCFVLKLIFNVSFLACLKKPKNSYTIVAHHKQKRCKIKSLEFLFQHQELISLWHVCLLIKLSKLLA